MLWEGYVRALQQAEGGIQGQVWTCTRTVCARPWTCQPDWRAHRLRGLWGAAHGYQPGHDRGHRQGRHRAGGEQPGRRALPHHQLQHRPAAGGQHGGAQLGQLLCVRVQGRVRAAGGSRHAGARALRAAGHDPWHRAAGLGAVVLGRVCVLLLPGHPGRARPQGGQGGDRRVRGARREVRGRDGWRHGPGHLHDGGGGRGQENRVQPRARGGRGAAGRRGVLHRPLAGGVQESRGRAQAVQPARGGVPAGSCHAGPQARQGPGVLHQCQDAAGAGGGGGGGDGQVGPGRVRRRGARQPARRAVHAR
mmetsp:Transcript_22675/g.57770  ORF Transcript_22675/g.57770 Transcript_22675/m.57770 type:complete len:306 (+) Transcript_22675:130-1047(+)